LSKKRKRSYRFGYRCPARLWDALNEILPLYNYSLSDTLTAILINWEGSRFRQDQILAVQRLRFRLLELEKSKKK